MATTVLRFHSCGPTCIVTINQLPSMATAIHRFDCMSELWWRFHCLSELWWRFHCMSVNSWLLLCFCVFLLRVTEHLGSGQFGTVNKGIWQSPAGAVEVAVKTLQSSA